MNSLVDFSPLLGGLGLVFALVLYMSILRGSPGTDRMREIADSIHSGAMVFMRREYKMLSWFCLALIVVLLFRPQGILGQAERVG